MNHLNYQTLIITIKHISKQYMTSWMFPCVHRLNQHWWKDRQLDECAQGILTWVDIAAAVTDYIPLPVSPPPQRGALPLRPTTPYPDDPREEGFHGYLAPRHCHLSPYQLQVATEPVVTLTVTHFLIPHHPNPSATVWSPTGSVDAVADNTHSYLPGSQWQWQCQWQFAVLLTQGDNYVKSQPTLIS